MRASATVTSKCLQTANKNHMLTHMESRRLMELKDEIANNTGVYCHKDRDIIACAENIRKILKWQQSITDPKELIAAQIHTGIMVMHDDELKSHFVIISASLLNDIIKVGVRSSLNSRLSRIGLKSVQGPIAEKIKDKTFLNQYRAMKRKWTVREPSEFFERFMCSEYIKPPETPSRALPTDILGNIGDFFHDFASMEECLNFELHIGA